MSFLEVEIKCKTIIERQMGTIFSCNTVCEIVNINKLRIFKSFLSYIVKCVKL